MLVRNISILNSIIQETAAAMSTTMYQNARYVNGIQGANVGYNTIDVKRYERGYSTPITCEKSKCGSDSNPLDEYCIMEA